MKGRMSRPETKASSYGTEHDGPVHEGGLSRHGRRFAIVAARFNDFIVEKLIDGAPSRRCAARAPAHDDVELFRCPGAMEIPGPGAQGRRHGQLRRHHLPGRGHPRARRRTSIWSCARPRRRRRAGGGGQDRRRVRRAGLRQHRAGGRAGGREGRQPRLRRRHGRRRDGRPVRAHGRRRRRREPCPSASCRRRHNDRSCRAASSRSKRTDGRSAQKIARDRAADPSPDRRRRRRPRSDAEVDVTIARYFEHIADRTAARRTRRTSDDGTRGELAAKIDRPLVEELVRGVTAAPGRARRTADRAVAELAPRAHGARRAQRHPHRPLRAQVLPRASPSTSCSTRRSSSPSATAPPRAPPSRTGSWIARSASSASGVDGTPADSPRGTRSSGSSSSRAYS